MREFKLLNLKGKIYIDLDQLVTYLNELKHEFKLTKRKEAKATVEVLEEVFEKLNKE